MPLRLNNFIDRLITDANNVENPQHSRWIRDNKKYSFVEKARIPRRSIKKIEVVFSLINEELKNYAGARVNQQTHDKMRTLIEKVQQTTQNYKQKHGKLYLFLSSLFAYIFFKGKSFGIDNISRDLRNNLENLCNNFNPNLLPNVFDNNDVDLDPPNPQQPDPFDDHFDDLFRQPNRPIKKPKTPDKTPNPQNDEDLLKPPVFSPYIPAEEDEVRKLENQVKNGRLKFYELFSEKINIPQDDENSINMPLVEITDKEVMIRLPKTMDKEFEEWLEGKLTNLREGGIKSTPLTTQRPGQRLVIPFQLFDGIQCNKEFKLSLEEAHQLIKDVPDNGIANLKNLTGNDELKIQHFHTLEVWGNAPSIPNTISVTLAQLDPSLKNDLNGITNHPQLHANHLAPIVEFDDEGMILKIPSSKESFSHLLKQLFGLKRMKAKDGADLQENQFDRDYDLYRLERDGIENFIIQLGLDRIPSEGLHERYANGDITYLQHLIETRSYHPYRPARTNDALVSIRDSLSALVYNEMHVKPHVSYHPRGWLSIKLPNWADDYNHKLADCLKTELIPVNYLFDGETYTNEIIIYEDDIPKFFKTLKLEKTPDDTTYVDRLKNYAGQESLVELYAENDRGQIDLLRTMCRRLAALDPETKEQLREFSPKGFPETTGIKLPKISFQQDVIEIRIPQDLNNKKIKIGPEKELAFGEYLAHVFAFDGQYQEFNGAFEYNIRVPLNSVKSCLEKDLALRTLPQEYRTEEVITCFNQFKKSYQPNYRPSGTIVNLRLRNPSIPLPEIIPDLTQAKVLDTFDKIFDDHPKKETHMAVFRETYRRILNTDNPNSPHYAEDNKHRATAAEIMKYLKVIAHELMTNKEISQDDKRAALINIAEECNNVCLPGRLTKIEKIYRKLKNPELEDEVKFLLLEKVDDLKEAVLSEYFRELPHSVHVVNLVKLEWGDELGLNKLAGRLDEDLRRNRDNLRENLHDCFLAPRDKPHGEVKRELEVAFRNNFLTTVYKMIRNSKDTEKDDDDKDVLGSISNFDDYQTRLRSILRKEGLKPDQIDAEIARLLPTQKVMKEILDREGKEALLKYMFVDAAKIKPEEIDAEIKELFLSESDDSVNITEEAVRMLLIDSHILNR